MKVLFDTSVLVASLVQSHPQHGRALPWLRRGKTGECDMYVSSHTLAELYAVLTTLPVSPRITSGISWRLIHENIEPSATIVSLSSSDYIRTVKLISEMGLSGGIIYDALIVSAALKSRADRLLTLNYEDFKRIWLEDSGRITVP